MKRLAAALPATAARAAVLVAVRLYARFVSPALPRRCKYHPTCSAYTEQAIRELGIARGLIVAGWRLLRCNPFARGGYDPLEARTLFAARPPAPPPPPQAERTAL